MGLRKLCKQKSCKTGKQPKACGLNDVFNLRMAVMSPVTPKPANRGQIKTGHSEVLCSYQFFGCTLGGFSVVVQFQFGELFVPKYN